MTTTERAPELTITRGCPYAPDAQHTELQRQGHLSKVTLPTGVEVWAVSNHADVRTVLTDRRFSANRWDPNFPVLTDGQRAGFRPSMISMDEPEHGPVRRGVVGEFTLKRMKALQPRIQEIVDECIDTMLAGPKPVDLVQALSLPVPSLVICELLGVPYADHDFFQSRTSKLLLRTTSIEERMRVSEEVDEFLSDLIAKKEVEPTDDLLGRQIVHGREVGNYDRDALVYMARLLLVAGHETTANMISLGTMSLIDHPEDAEALRNDPSKIPVAIEELLRYFTIAEFVTSRVAVEDVELGGTLIKAGEGVVTLSNVANRDPEVFPGGEELDLQRGARHHVTFGYGVHQCLGQNLARMELEIVYATLLRRLPGLRSAVPTAELPFKNDANIFGIHEFPVTWL